MITEIDLGQAEEPLTVCLEGIEPESKRGCGMRGLPSGRSQCWTARPDRENPP